MPVESLYLDLFAPAARLLGEMWSDDHCDFSAVTVALGRLQRLLRELSPAFGTEIEYPRQRPPRAVAQPPDEQHSFGLCMVAEFFRRDGWDVFGVVGGAVDDPVGARAQGMGRRRRPVDRLRAPARLAATLHRRGARGLAQPGVVVMVGGPIFTLHPDWRGQRRRRCHGPRCAATRRVSPTRLLMATRRPLIRRVLARHVCV